MGTYSETEFVSHMAHLTMAQDVIQRLGQWILHHQPKHGDELVVAWSKTLEGENDPSRMVMYLYVANEVIQNARKKCPHYQQTFYKVLESAFKYVGRANTKETEKTLNRLVGIWRERGIYTLEQCANLETAMKNGRKRLPSENNTLSMMPRSPKEKQHHHHHKKPKETTAPYDPEQLRRTIDELKSVLGRLADPSSTDEETRNKISALPEYVGNVDKLNSLRCEAEAKVVSKAINEAEPMVKEYCRKISNEIMDRRNLQDLLHEFLNGLRSSSDKYIDDLQTLKRIQEKLQKEKAEIQVAYESLPDLNDAPSDSAVPLPTFENLFNLRR